MGATGLPSLGLLPPLDMSLHSLHRFSLHDETCDPSGSGQAFRVVEGTVHPRARRWNSLGPRFAWCPLRLRRVVLPWWLVDFGNGTLAQSFRSQLAVYLAPDTGDNVR